MRSRVAVSSASQVLKNPSSSAYWFYQVVAEMRAEAYRLPGQGRWVKRQISGGV